MSTQWKLILAIVACVVALCFVTRWLSMREQKAVDDMTWQRRVDDAVDSTTIAVYKRFTQAPADTQRAKAVTVARRGPTSATPETIAHGGGEADSLCRAAVDSLEAKNRRLSELKQTHIVHRDSSESYITFDPLDQILPFTEVYVPFKEEFDSTVVSKLRYVVLPPATGWEASDWVLLGEAVAVIIWALIRYL